jgi:hypothetical protein
VLTVVRTRASLVWFFLAVLTIVSWALGTDHSLTGEEHVPASLVILVVAIVKVRLVGLYFMELRFAPVQLRAVFETYCAAVLILLSSLYVFA